MVAMAQAGLARDLKMAGLEADLKELNDRLGVASRHHTAMIQEVDGRLRTHIDSVVRDISDAIQAADNRLRDLVGTACATLENALTATVQAASDRFEGDRQESRLSHQWANFRRSWTLAWSAWRRWRPAAQPSPVQPGQSSST